MGADCCIITGMKLESVGILLSLRPFGERDAVARIFTRDFGLMVGMLRGAAVMTRRRPMVGTVGDVSWNARLDSQLGAFQWDANRNPAAAIMSRGGALGFMNAAFELIGALLPERESFSELYDETLELLELGNKIPGRFGICVGFNAVCIMRTGGRFEIFITAYGSRRMRVVWCAIRRTVI